MDSRTNRAFISAVGAKVGRRANKRLYCDELLAPIIDLHINAETLRDRPVLKAILPKEFYPPSSKGQEPRAEQDASDKAKDRAGAPEQASSADKSVAVAKVASMQLADLLKIPPNKCACMQERASCGDCGLGFLQREEVLGHLLKTTPDEPTTTTVPPARELKPNASNMTDLTSASDLKKRKAATDASLLLDEESSDDEVFEEACNSTIGPSPKCHPALDTELSFILLQPLRKDQFQLRFDKLQTAHILTNTASKVIVKLKPSTEGGCDDWILLKDTRVAGLVRGQRGGRQGDREGEV